jgi:hypothetical protein
MDIYYDGNLSATYKNTKWIPQVDEYLWLSDGASFGIKGDNFTSQPVGFLTSAYVDYIRVWKKTPVTTESTTFWAAAAINSCCLQSIDGTSPSYSFDNTNTINWIKTTSGQQELFKAVNVDLMMNDYPAIMDDQGQEGRVFRFNSFTSLSNANSASNAEYHRLIGNSPGKNQTIYVSFLSQVRKLNDGSVSFPIGFSNYSGVGGAASWGSRLLISNPNAPHSSNTGTYNFGLDKGGTSNEVNLSKTYTARSEIVFVVMKLTMDSDIGNANDKLELYTSTSIPMSEPDFDISTSLGDDLNVNAIFLREKMDGYFDNSRFEDHHIDIDEIRVANSWEGLFTTVTDAGIVSGGSGSSGSTFDQNTRIGSMQVFLVQANTARSILFKESIREINAHQDAQFFRMYDASYQVAIELSGSDFRDETLLVLTSKAVYPLIGC